MHSLTVIILMTCVFIFIQPMAGVGDILGPGPGGGPQPVMKPTNLTIKQVSSTDRKDKRKLPNKEQLKHATVSLQLLIWCGYVCLY